MLLIFSGTGKGKTSAAAGTALRAWGQGRKVLFLAFLKCGWKSGEFKAVHKIRNENFSLYAYGRECPYGEQDCCPGDAECIVTGAGVPDQDRIRIENGLDTLEEAIREGTWDLIIADELLNVWTLFSQYRPRINEAIRNRSLTADLILTGRSCPDDLQQEADIYSEIQSFKHPFYEGLLARRGIDY